MVKTHSFLDVPRVAMHVVTSLDFGGVERHMEVIASVLDEANFHHVFVALGSGGAAEIKIKALNREVYCLNKNTSIPSISPIIALIHLIRRLHPLVIHTHGAEANFHGLIAAWICRVPIRIGEEIGIPTHKRLAQLIFKLIYKTSSKVIGVADAVVNWIISTGETTFEQSIRIYNPVILPIERLEEDIPNGDFTICFVGRLEEVKNPISLVNAIGLLKKEGVKVTLNLVGDGSQLRHLIDIAEQMNITKCINFYGFQADPFPYIRKSDIFIQPSISEGLSLALVEAIGCGVPVIASPVGGSPEIIVHNKTGWLLKDSTPESIVAAIKLAMALGRKNLCKMGHESRIEIRDKFEPLVYLKKLEILYIELATD